MIKTFIAGLLFLVFTGCSNVSAIEEPKYSVIEKSGDFELREYEPKIIAEVEVSGTMKKASNEGFRLIADYIFGNNTSQNGSAEKIAMTAPVTMDSAEETKSEKISMTAPVNIEKTGKTWRVHFVMPSKYTLKTLPKPNNPAVKIRQIKGSKYAVIRFSGFVGDAKVAAKTADLRKWLADKNIKPVGEPELARYDPPWTLPFMRRNEVMIQY